MDVFEACTEEALNDIALHIVDDIKKYKIVLFNGNLGAGKTTFIKTLCKALKIEDNFSSPTFSIINTYYLNEDKIYHMDLYRINEPSELLDFGFEEYIDSGNICFIEWPEIALPYIQGAPFMNINIEVDSSTNCRKISIVHHKA